MISADEAQILADEIDRLMGENARLTAENGELRHHVDWLLRERLDAKSLEQEARKAAAAKVLMTVREQAVREGGE